MTRKILFILFLISSISLTAQRQQFLGINLNSEIPSGNNIKAGFGLFYENQLSKHNGFVVGLNYRNKTNDLYITYPDLGIIFEKVQVREIYLSLPVMYKFYSNFVNLSTGINFDYFVGWKDLTKLYNYKINSYDIDPNLYVGWKFAVSKSIDISPKLIIEPEIFYNPIFNYNYSYTGISLKLKYKL